MDDRSPEVLVVLGCRLVGGAAAPTLVRRLETARAFHRQMPHLPIIMSGGRMWSNMREADAMASWWLGGDGSKTPSVVRENVSQNTRENAHHVAAICRKWGSQHVALVTCDVHMKRASWLFVAAGLRVTPVPVKVARPLWVHWKLTLREQAATWLEGFRAYKT